MSKDDRELIERLRAKRIDGDLRTDGHLGRERIPDPDCMLAATRLEALQAQPVGEAQGDCVVVRRDVISFLRGEGELDGQYYGDDTPPGEYRFWWRKYLAALTASPPVVEREAKPQDENCPHCHGEGSVEHPHLTGAYGGSHAIDPPDPVLVECEDCHGTGKVERDD